jgi:hypothetical protein
MAPRVRHSIPDGGAVIRNDLAMPSGTMTSSN